VEAVNRLGRSALRTQTHDMTRHTARVGGRGRQTTATASCAPCPQPTEGHSEVTERESNAEKIHTCLSTLTLASGPGASWQARAKRQTGLGDSPASRPAAETAFGSAHRRLLCGASFERPTGQFEWNFGAIVIELLIIRQMRLKNKLSEACVCGGCASTRMRAVVVVAVPS
jgi:hypothetical protein